MGNEARPSEGGESDSAAGESRATRVMIVDDHPVVRRGIRDLIEAQPGMTVSAEAATVKEALAGLARALPDVVVADLSLPDGGDMDLVRALHDRHPDLPVLVLSMHDECIYAERALRAGARGYVTKQEPPERIIEGIRTVLRGEAFVSQKLAATLFGSWVAGSTRSSRVGVERLSSRELQVFCALGRGATTTQVAETLSVSVKTVETYRAHIKRKLNLPNGNALLQAAIRWVEAEARGFASPPQPSPPAAARRMSPTR